MAADMAAGPVPGLRRGARLFSEHAARARLAYEHSQDRDGK